MTTTEQLEQELLTHQIQEQIHINSIMQSRADIAQRAGYAFGNDRDYYKVLGWRRTLEFEDYLEKYERQDIASRIVDAPAEDTWRDNPKVLDGVNETADDTDFVTSLTELLDGVGAWADFEDADALAGLGHYGVLLIGVAGAEDFSQPVERADMGDIVYLRAYDQGQADILEVETDKQSPRFGLPTLYQIDIGEDTTDVSASRQAGVTGRRVVEGGTDKQMTVHWTRVIHVAENARRSQIYGTPRLRPVFNLLDDLLKTEGGSAEAVWQLVYMGMIITTRDGYKLPPSGTTERDDFDDQVDRWKNDIRRVLIGEGLDVAQPGGQTIDPSGMVDVIISLISATTKIPKRILLGSERGELASSQDAASWAGRIAGRRAKFAERVILRPFVDRLIQWEAIPAPTSGKYSFEWKPLFEQNEGERATTAKTYAEALNVAAQAESMGAVDMRDFRERLTPFPSEIEIEGLDFDAEDVTPVEDDETRPMPEADMEASPNGAGTG